MFQGSFRRRELGSVDAAAKNGRRADAFMVRPSFGSGPT
jgi:hypothetical protein